MDSIKTKLGEMPPQIKSLLSIDMNAETLLGKKKSDGIYGVAYISISPTTTVKGLLLGAKNGMFTLGLKIEDVARMINKDKTFNMVFVPALSESFKTFMMSSEFPSLADSLTESIGHKPIDSPLFCCTISGSVYNKGNKTLSVKPRFLSPLHLDVFNYLSVQNDNWRCALRL